MSRYFITTHHTSLSLELKEDGFTVTYTVSATNHQEDEGRMILVAHVHLRDCEITQPPGEPYILAMGYAVVPLAGHEEARAVARHLGLTMPAMHPGLVSLAGHA